MLPLTLKLWTLSLGERPPTAASVGLAWLGRCVGFDVYGPDGRVGPVTHVRFGAVGRPDAVVVRSGLFIRRFTVVRWDHVDYIEPSQRRLMLTILPGCRASGIALKLAGNQHERRSTLNGIRFQASEWKREPR